LRVEKPRGEPIGKISAACAQLSRARALQEQLQQRCSDRGTKNKIVSLVPLPRLVCQQCQTELQRRREEGPMRSLFVTMDPNVTGAAAAASTLAERGSAAERALPRSGVGVRIDGCGYFLSPPHGKP
jgi:hypothetical protein